ncbi:aminotransferase family protein [Natronolimnohabitans innermongolicus]|uniref:Acetylornithine transaminase n=1 Tax=Natronolimnohabitans innermongolicus JCM 12255 TaxID=1227499 RepID=L9WVQ5_9EURY|nr:aspartate aminotransferase family protein [Natronolimnohabitans innermongolicus]ELY53281.1 acetylornithine transaminase [Natronolimnohabitans innermongolicus JCM 12255]
MDNGNSDNGRVIQHWYDADHDPLTIVEGEDATVYDDDGTAYLDFLSQLYCCNAGHSNERITSAIAEQAERIPYVSASKHNDARTRLADDLAEIAPGSLSDVFFAISGSEANETAIQIARTIQDAPTVLTRWQSYHGGTYGAGGLTGDPGTRKTLERYAATSGVEKFLPPLPSAFDAETPDELAHQAADHVEFVIRNEGPESVAAILTEPIGGTSGAYPAPPGYFERLREICDEYDVLLISDEVISGFGRCGEWFGIQTEDVEPDLLTFAKGVTGAYAPLAGVVVDDWIGEEIRSGSYDLGQTFAGHPISCAAGEAALEVYRDGLLERGRERSPHLESRLRDLEDRFEPVETIRGRGLLWSVVFADPETGEPFVHPWVDPDADNPVAAVRSEAQKRGVLVGGGRPDVQLIVAPPLCVTREEIDEAVDALAASIDAVFGDE